MSTDLKKKGPEDLRKFIEGDAVREQIAKALPSLCTPERFLRVAMTAITKTPKLLGCDRDSFISCLLDCAQLGIEPDGRRAHLIPFNKNKKVGGKWVVEKVMCQLIIDYKGLVELSMRSGKISNIHADKICYNDDFIYDAGRVIKHQIDFRKERGDVYAYYAKAEFKDGSQRSEVMTVSDVNIIRGRSKSKDNGPWATDFDEMAKKTVFRRLSKWLPLSPEDSQALGSIEDKEFKFDMPINLKSELPIPTIEGPTAETVIKSIDAAKSISKLDEVMTRAKNTNIVKDAKAMKEIEAAEAKKRAALDPDGFTVDK